MTHKPSLNLQALLFILPAIALLLVFLAYPTVWTLQLSLFRGRGFELDNFVGFDNYVRLLTRDPNFLDIDWPPSGAVFNNVLWILLYVPLTIGLGLLIATLANGVNYEALLKAIIFLPQGIAAAAVGVIWLFVYSPDPNIGVINAIRNGMGMRTTSWLGDTDTVNLALIVAHVWASTGFAMVVISAALKGIPTDVVEASRVDGANSWQSFRFITLPMLSLPISVVAVTLIINVVKLFDLIYIMTRGGPRNASRVIAFTMYSETFEGGRGGYGAAVAVIMLLVILPIMIFNIRRFRAERIV